jgi:hypothetical protein
MRLVTNSGIEGHSLTALDSFYETGMEMPKHYKEQHLRIKMFWAHIQIRTYDKPEMVNIIWYYIKSNFHLITCI